MPWFRSILSSILVLILLCSCGGPDPKLVLADAHIQFAAAEAAVGQGEWIVARGAWLAGAQLIEPHATLTVEGVTLAQHRDQAGAALEASLSAVAPRLLADAERNNATWVAVQELITTCGSTSLRATWQQESKAILGRLEVAAATAKQAAEEAERVRRSQAYMCWVACGSETKQHALVQWRKTLAKQLAPIFAPVEIIMLDAAPKTREGLGSISIRLQWDHVAYSGGIGAGMGVVFDNDKVPVQLDATMVVTTWVKPGDRDGEQSWRLRKEAPKQVGQYGITSLADAHRTALLKDLDKAISELPPLTNGAALIEAAKTYVPPRSQATWAYSVTSHTLSDQPNALTGVHGFASVGQELVEVLSDHWGIIDLKNATEKPAASGTVTIAIEAFEETFGRTGSGVNTINGTIPTSMKATVTITPAVGTTTNWPATKTWTASEPAPEKIDVNNLDAQVVRSRAALVKQLTAKIRAEPQLELKSKP
jgi:hypothetical protein